MDKDTNLLPVDKGQENPPLITSHKTDTDSRQLGARTTILNMTELLEHILFYLPTTELIRTRGVSKHFRNLVDNSPKLKRAAFRQGNNVPLLDIMRYEASDRGTANSDSEPGPAPTDLRSILFAPGSFDLDSNSDPGPELPAFLCDNKPLTIKPIRSTIYDSLRSRAIVVRYDYVWEMALKDLEQNTHVFVVALNPVFPIHVKLDGDDPKLCRLCAVHREMPNRFRYEEQFLGSFLSRRLPARDAIFWDTLISQPAVAAITLCVDRCASSTRPTQLKTVYRPEGVTMRDVYQGFRAIGLRLYYGMVAKKQKSVRAIYIAWDGAAGMADVEVRAVENCTGGLVKCNNASRVSNPLGSDSCYENESDDFDSDLMSDTDGADADSEAVFDDLHLFWENCGIMLQ